MRRKRDLLIPLLVLLVLFGSVVVFLLVKGKFQKQKASLGEQIYEQVQNPISGKIPETNPFVKVNPFKGVYKNPFE